jgi:hypothetical protein
MKKLIAVLLLLAAPAQAKDLSAPIFFAIEAVLNPSVPVQLDKTGKHLTAGCHVTRVSPTGSTYSATYDASCTAAQIAAGNAAMDAWTAAHQ